MNSAEKETVLHCLKSMIDEASCEECPLYGMTGTDHCEKDCVRLAINALSGSEKPNYTDAEIQKMQDLEFAEIQKAYEIGKAEKPNKWIPVSERLPEEETDVLICNAKGDIAVSRGSYSTEMKNEFIWYTSGWRFGKVVAWMPLPEPYKASPTRTERSEKE